MTEEEAKKGRRGADVDGQPAKNTCKLAKVEERQQWEWRREGV